MRALLRHREFRLLFLGQTASTLGDRLVFVALALYVTDIGDASDVGLVLAAHALPLVAFLLVGGVWADRLPRHRVMVVTDLLRAALHTLLAVLIFLGPVPIWAIVLIETAFGTAEAFFRPAYTGLVPQTVPEELLQEATAVNGFVFNASEFVGPALATALVLGLGAGWAFALDAVTFLVSAAFLVRMRPRERGEAGERRALVDELRIGWAEVRSRQWVWVTIAVTSVALLLALAPLFTLGPTVAREVYGGFGAYGLLSSAFGIGTVAGSLLGLRWRPRHPMRAGFSWVLLWPPAVSLFALGFTLWVVVPLWVVSGVGLALFIVWWETALAERIPPHTLSRVSSFDWMGSLALLPLGYLLAGPIGEALGEAEVLAAGGLLGLLVQLVGLLSPGVWRLERLQPAKSARPSSVVEA